MARPSTFIMSALGMALVAGSAAHGAIAFGAGDLAVFEATGTTSNSTFSIIELSRSIANQSSPVQSINISADATAPMWTSASATSTGYLSLSQDRTTVLFDAHTNNGNGSVNINTIGARGVGAVSGTTGVYSKLADYTGGSGNQARSATQLSNGNLYISDQGGLYASGGSSAALAGNTRNIRNFFGVPYTLLQSTTATNIVVSSVGGSPTSPTLTGLAGLSNSGTAQDFYMVDSDGDQAADLLYITTNTSASAGSILKYQLVSGSWVARGSATTTGLFGLAAEEVAGGVQLYATSGTGASSANNVLSFLDSSAPSADISLSASTTLFTAPTGTNLKGIEVIPAPGSFALVGLGGLLASRRRR